jgi:putative ABC transport system permease protein
MMEQSLGLELAQAMAWAVSALSLAVGLVGASNTMLMSVFEQRRTIGILRAIGWRRKRILELIAAEALMLSLAAYLLGLALGIGASELLSQVDATRNVLQPRST